MINLTIKPVLQFSSNKFYQLLFAVTAAINIILLNLRNNRIDETTCLHLCRDLLSTILCAYIYIYIYILFGDYLRIIKHFIHTHILNVPELSPRHTHTHTHMHVFCSYSPRLLAAHSRRTLALTSYIYMMSIYYYDIQFFGIRAMDAAYSTADQNQ